MKSSQICTTIREVGLIPVVRVTSAALAVAAAEALFAGGLPIFEVTLTVPGALDAIRTLSERFGEAALVGAGTVLSARDADACIDAGARFIVSPGVDIATIETTRARGAASLPGALTPSEVIQAWQAGASMVKVFPCSALGGPAYVRALRGPLPNVLLLPTGGVTLETAAAYIAAGATALGVGSELVDSAELSRGDSLALSRRAREFVQRIAHVRGKAA